MKLIDADNIGLTDIEIIMCNGSYKDAFIMLIDKICNAPIVDAVPVVRCEDCENWDKDSYYLNRDEADCYCIMVDHRTTPDFYCGDGKREEV